MRFPATVDATAPPQNQQYIGFRLPPALHILLPNTDITAVISLNVAEIVSLPEMPACVMGFINWHGEALWLVDTNMMVDQTPLYQSVAQGICPSHLTGLVVQYQQHTVGLVVEQVTPLQQLPASAIRPLAFEQSIPSIPGLAGAWVSPTGDRHWLLDSTTLLQSLIPANVGDRSPT